MFQVKKTFLYVPSSGPAKTFTGPKKGPKLKSPTLMVSPKNASLLEGIWARLTDE